MNVLEFIDNNYNKFTHGERKISDFLLNCNYKEILRFTAKKIGEKTGTSASTVVRFAKRIGFKSFNELKLQVSINIKEQYYKQADFEYLGKELSASSLIKHIKNSLGTTIEKTCEMMDPNELEKAINILIKAENIYIYGVGNSSLVGADFFHKLSRINKRTIFHIDTHLQITTSVLMKKEDVAIAISYSGETSEVLECVRNANEIGAAVISITKNSINNILSEYSTITLNIPEVEKNLREGAMASRIAQLTVIDMLFIGISSNSIEDSEKKLIKTRKAINNYKNTNKFNR